MGLLERLFAQVEHGKLRSLNTVQLWKSHKNQIERWKEYMATVDEKAVLVKAANPDVARLIKLLRTDIVDIDTITVDDAGLLKELQTLGTVMGRIRYVNRLTRSLEYEETRYTYVYRLLRQLHDTLLAQVKIVDRLAQGSSDKRLLDALKVQVKVEEVIVDKIKRMETIGTSPNPEKFHYLLLQLLGGARAADRLDDQQRHILARLAHILPEDVLKSGDIPKGIARKFENQWVNAVFDVLWLQLEQAIDDGTFEHHPDVEWQFVNSAQFVELASQTYVGLRNEQPRPDLLQAFVTYFRKLFNESR